MFIVTFKSHIEFVFPHFIIRWHFSPSTFNHVFLRKRFHFYKMNLLFSHVIIKIKVTFNFINT